MKTFLAFLGRSAPWPPLRWLSLREGWPSGDVSPNLTVNCKLFGPHLGLFSRKNRWKTLDLTLPSHPKAGPPPDLSPGPAVPLARCLAWSYRPGPSQDQRQQGSPEFKGSSATGSHLTDLRQAFLLIFTAQQSFANL